jgi:hypothetical protein
MKSLPWMNVASRGGSYPGSEMRVPALGRKGMLRRLEVMTRGSFMAICHPKN